MSYEPPTPPTELSTDLIDTLDGYTADQLRHVASYSEKLAEHKEREERIQEDSEDEEVEDHADDIPDDLPDDVPARATETTKEIKGNLYDYWQWREDGELKSKYRGPAKSK